MINSEYAYYPGCSLEGTALEYDKSLRVIFNALGISIKEPEDWSCCGSSPAHTVDHIFAAALAARNLALIEKMNIPVVAVPCPSCMTAFKKAHLGMTEKESFRNAVNELLDDPYKGGVTTKSALQIMYEDVGLEAIAQKVTHELPDLKVAPYYGCILNRPPEIAQFDDPENPIAMDKILSAVGIQVNEFAFKTECCGAAFGVPKRAMVNELTYKVLSMAIDAGANCVAVACPLCQQNLDLRQAQVNASTGSSLNIPVLYFTQLMGLAYGYSPKELGIDKLIVNPDRLIQSRRLIDNKQEKEEDTKTQKAEPNKKESEQQDT